MARIAESDLKQIAAALSTRVAGAGYVYNGDARFLANNAAPCGHFCNSLRGKGARKACKTFYQSLATTTEPAAITCPFGFHIFYIALDDVAGCPARIVVHSYCGPSESARLLLDRTGSAFARDERKRLTGGLSEMPKWSNDGSVVSVLRETYAAAVGQAHAIGEADFHRALEDYKDFVASFSHEALSPLQEIRTSLELAAKRLNTVDQDSHDSVVQAVGALDRVRIALEGMRLLFDPAKDLLSNQLIQVDVYTTIQDWCRIYKSKCDNRNLRVYYEPPRGPWSLRVVPQYFEVLISNLISNGIKYSFDARTYNDPGKIVFRFDSTHRSLTVVNFGVPIPREDIDSGALFELSHRSKTAGDRGRTGKGVGLYLVGLIAKLLNATISVQSEIMNPSGKEIFARNEFRISFR